MTWCFADERTKATDALLERLKTETALVPSLWTLETANVLLVAERRGRLTVAQTSLFVSTLLALPIVVAEPDAGYMTQLVATARPYKLSAYDAAYVALAVKTGLPLATLDKGVIGVCMQLGVALL